MASLLTNSSASCLSGDTLRPGRYAAIDIGTVTCRMLIADIDKEGGLHELRREYAITNLGEGVDATGMLKPEAMRRVVDVVARYQDILHVETPAGEGSITVVAMATSASRDAKNAAEFVGMLADLGVALTVIPGEREAGLSFSGASCDFVGEELLVIDVGGGSTEIIAGQGGGSPVRAHSFNIGCRRVTEKFLSSDPPSADELSRARTWIEEGMRPFFDDLRAAGFAPQRLVAVAGTATSVVSVRERMETYDTARVHKATVARAALDQVYGQLSALPLAERRHVVGLDPGRAPVMVAGLVILQVVLDLAGADSFTVSESDILHGIILHAAASFPAVS
ncbi:Ppx/GppA phosphatase family protein [Gordonibacter sp.]|uniref:Ppx/GppA phosphatase family protein n=1 Tax=Gordonibacter sp. TaxID=1968902 RepID=UPI002FC84A70